MRKIVLLSLPALLAIPAIAQMPTELPGKKDKARVTAGTYTVDPAHTIVGWKVNHLGFNDYFGLFGEPTGTLTIDPANLAAAKVEIEIPISKLLVANEGLSKHLASADFFDTQSYPTAKFVSTAVAVDEDGDEAKVTGDLTIKGITQSVVLDVDFTGAGKSPNPKAPKDTIGFEAETTIRRSAFGMSYGIMNGVELVSDKVELDITVAFEK